MKRAYGDPTAQRAQGRLHEYASTAAERRRRVMFIDEQLQAARRRAAEEKSLESAPTDLEANEPDQTTK